LGLAPSLLSAIACGFLVSGFSWRRVSRYLVDDRFRNLRKILVIPLSGMHASLVSASVRHSEQIIGRTSVPQSGRLWRMDHVSAECRMVEAHNERHSMHRAFAVIPQLLHPVLVVLRAASASERFSHPQTRLKTITPQHSRVLFYVCHFAFHTRTTRN